jgi:hypothetical protein
MEWRWIDREITYDGTQLRSGWVREQTELGSDGVACFAGPADVPVENLVDMEDAAANAHIFSPMMLHFIVEHTDGDLLLAVARQRLMVSITMEELIRLTEGAPIERRGDDIYEGNLKISVSIATSSPKSQLIHFGVNVISDGTPVPTKGLADYDIETKTLGEIVSKKYCEEIASMMHATQKVRPVK